MLDLQNSFPGGHSEVAPPDPISNSEVKRFCADGSVGFPHVRVGHRQVLFRKPLIRKYQGFFFVVKNIKNEFFMKAHSVR